MHPHVLTMQAEIDRIKVVQSRLILEADRHRIWAASGHRNIEAWLAANGRTTVAAATKQKQLGEALNASRGLSNRGTPSRHLW